jgi:uncharacterized protein
MMRTRISDRRQFAISTFVFLGFFAFTSNLLASSSGEPEISTMRSGPEPRSIEQEIKLANDYFAGRGVERDFKQSAYWFEMAAKRGDPQAQVQIGYFYEAGIGVAKDPERAAHWYQLAASDGLASANVNLGVLYFWGIGVKKNEQLAIQLFREAANHRSGLADCYLGDLYYLGAGVPRNESVGERWYRKGAEMHNPQAEYNLGLLFFDRPDHVRDLRKAVTLLRESSAAGYVPAMYSLGLLLARNPGLSKSSDEANTLLNDSANAGTWKSSVILGVLARDGKAGPRDSGAAYYHFRVAILQGGDDARKRLENDIRRLSSSLGPVQTNELDAQAENWYQRHHKVLEFVPRTGKNRNGFPDYAVANPENGTHDADIPSQPN